MKASLWIERFAPLVKPTARVLDLACGAGRHGRLFLDRGAEVLFADKDVNTLADLQDHVCADIRQIDLEDGRVWPFETDAFDCIVVTNYLYRPHMPVMLDSLRAGGVLLYETFALGNERFGSPRNPDFLLKPGELLELVNGRLNVIAYEHGQDGDKVVQRICAVRGTSNVPAPLYP